MPKPMSGPMQAVVSFARYPIGDLQAPAARDVIAAARRQLDTTGLCMLPNFITGDALATMRTEALAALPLAVRHAAPLAQNLDLGITPCAFSRRSATTCSARNRRCG
ncbi:MAG: hypothetical protein RII27_02295, partial [Alphaproteobacteria bacterium]